MACLDKRGEISLLSQYTKDIRKICTLGCGAHLLGIGIRRGIEFEIYFYARPGCISLYQLLECRFSIGHPVPDGNSGFGFCLFKRTARKRQKAKPKITRKSPLAATLSDFRSGIGKCFILSCTIKNVLLASRCVSCFM